MKTQLFVCLVLCTVSVRSNYTWNGSEWVYSEDKTPSANNPVDNYGQEEGSGNRYNDFYEEDDDDTGYDYDEGSGSDSNVEDDWNRQTSNPDQNQNSRNNNNFQDPYDSWGHVDPYNNHQNPGGYDNMNPNRGQDNSQIYYSTSPPYIGNEVENNDDIYVDPPAMIPTTTTTMVPPRDPSISSRPKDTSRSTSFFAQPGTLAAVIGGAVVGLLCAILCVMFVVYRMRKKDEGSYALDEPKRSPTVNAYAKHPSREFYA